MEEREIRLKAVVRKENEIGSRPSGRLRRQGWIVGVIYGKNYGPIPLKIRRKDFESALRRRWRGALVRLDIEGDGFSDSQLCIIRELQRDPLTDEILCLDFQRVTAEMRIRRSIPIVLKGTPAGAEKGGVLQQILHEAEVEAPVGLALEALEVDVSSLDIGDTLKVGDIPVPEGVRMMEDPEEPVATVTPPEVEEEEKVEEAVEEEKPPEAEEKAEKKEEGEQ